MGKIIKWSFLGMATICGAGRGMVETHLNSMPSRMGQQAALCTVDMDSRQTRETGASVPDVSPLLT